MIRQGRVFSFLTKTGGAIEGEILSWSQEEMTMRTTDGANIWVPKPYDNLVIGKLITHKQNSAEQNQIEQNQETDEKEFLIQKSKEENPRGPKLIQRKFISRAEEQIQEEQSHIEKIKQKLRESGRELEDLSNHYGQPSFTKQSTSFDSGEKAKRSSMGSFKKMRNLFGK